MKSELDISERLEELKTLKDGWLDGIGLAPSKEGMDWLKEILDKYYPESIAQPRLYPTELGEILAEWKIGNYMASLEIDLKTHFGSWHVLDVVSDRDYAEEIDLSDENGWGLVIGKITRLEDGDFK